jgi:hypothetical protein
VEEDDVIVDTEYRKLVAQRAAASLVAVTATAATTSGKGHLSASTTFETVSYVVTLSYNESSEITASAKRKGGIGAFFSFPIALVRGWGGPSEEDSANDDKPAKHLVLVVHGIGESMFSKGGAPLPSFKESVARMRSIGQDFSAENEFKTEFIPVEWFHKVQEKKDELAQSTLPSIPIMRQFANEALLDGMLLLTPRWRKVILDTVTEGLSKVFQVFLESNPEWNPENVSVVGHSLGSVILFELLSAKGLPVPQVLPFVPRYFVALGSPIAVFLNTVEEDPSWLNERITNMRVSKSMRNVFHPNDPVAYRLEPLLVPCQHQKTSQDSSAEQGSKEDGFVEKTEHQKLDAVLSATSPLKVNFPSSSSATLLPPPSPVFIHTVSGDDRLHVKWHKATSKMHNQQAKLKRVVADASAEWTGKFSGLWGGAGGGNDGNSGGSGTSGAGEAEDKFSSVLSKPEHSDFCLKCFDARIPQRGMPPSDLASFEDSTGGLMKLLRGKTGPQDDDAKAKAEVTKAMRCKLREAHRIDYVLQVSEFELSLTEYLSALQAHTCYFETPDVVKFILETLDDA